MDPRAPNQEQKPVDYEGLTSFLGVDNSFFTPWRPSSPPVDYERLTSFARPDNSFLSPWNFDPNNPSPQTSQPPQRMTFEPGSYFSPELVSIHACNFCFLFCFVLFLCFLKFLLAMYDRNVFIRYIANTKAGGTCMD